MHMSLKPSRFSAVILTGLTVGILSMSSVTAASAAPAASLSPVAASVTSLGRWHAATPSQCGLGLPRTSTQEDGVPGSRMWALMQCMARSGGYTGPIDGEMGANSWRGVQGFLSQKGFYSGAQSGSLDSQTSRGLQKLGQQGGYTGPIDGSLGTASWRAIATYLNNNYSQ